MDVTALLELYRRRGMKIAAAESCTGGLVAATLTAVAGSSDVFERGWVTYSNAAKADCLGVPPELIAAKGAVSSEVAQAMASGALRSSSADVAVSVTGIAGPGGGSAAKPVGLVYIGIARKDGWLQVERCVFEGERPAIREQSVARALAHLATAAVPA